jgi:hypothetical protein
VVVAFNAEKTEGNHVHGHGYHRTCGRRQSNISRASAEKRKVVKGELHGLVM